MSLNILITLKNLTFTKLHHKEVFNSSVEVTAMAIKLQILLGSCTDYRSLAREHNKPISYQEPNTRALATRASFLVEPIGWSHLQNYKFGSNSVIHIRRRSLIFV